MSQDDRAGAMSRVASRNSRTSSLIPLTLVRMSGEFDFSSCLSSVPRLRIRCLSGSPEKVALRPKVFLIIPCSGADFRTAHYPAVLAEGDVVRVGNLCCVPTVSCRPLLVAFICCLSLVLIRWVMTVLVKFGVVAFGPVTLKLNVRVTVPQCPLSRWPIRSPGLPRLDLRIPWMKNWSPRLPLSLNVARVAPSS